MQYAVWDMSSWIFVAGLEACGLGPYLLEDKALYRLWKRVQRNRSRQWRVALAAVYTWVVAIQFWAVLLYYLLSDLFGDGRRIVFIRGAFCAVGSCRITFVTFGAGSSGSAVVVSVGESVSPCAHCS